MARLADIQPLKLVSEEVKRSSKYRQIAASVGEIGLVEPPVVARSRDDQGKFLLLDGHLRLEVLRDRGLLEIECLVSTEDEAFTYNKRVNRIAIIQEHRMILKAVENGVSEARIGETKDKSAHQPTQAELKAKADWEENRRKWPSLYSRDRQHWRSWDNRPSGRLSLTLTDPLRLQWQDGHVLGRWHDRKSSKLGAHLDEVLVGMLAGAATARHNRIAAEAEKRRREEAHQAYLKEQERRRYEAQVDAFIEGKADELFRLQKILAFRDYIAREPGAPRSPEEDAVLRATNDLISRLQHGLSADTLKNALKSARQIS
ncbi:ParB N-terminal domain-containing protein [Bradyrhizobium japonicum]|uniref:ParB N-terminal domain-containing protein n=1 Tax=Bradyrhizobium japonicum TaxID=375 RepID=UPI001FCCBFCB|nr:ParB N-terminal domain-containing protein [Bradyrhizobium japonicum]WLB19962.1 ParB N-terminal domain-containing protein [Bradyrhizobium japonicum]